jgi:hypothetical protein
MLPGGLQWAAMACPAFPIYMRTLTDTERERILGNEHPTTLTYRTLARGPWQSRGCAKATGCSVQGFR